jgi:hypothetical protein
MMRRIPLVAALALVTGCQDAPTAPPPVAMAESAAEAESDGPLMLAASPEDIALAATAVDDALGRVLPHLGAGDATAAIRLALEAVSIALATGDSPRLLAATARARQAMADARGAGTGDPFLPLHLDLVSLAVDRAAALVVGQERPNVQRDQGSIPDPVSST